SDKLDSVRVIAAIGNGERRVIGSALPSLQDGLHAAVELGAPGCIWGGEAVQAEVAIKAPTSLSIVDCTAGHGSVAPGAFDSSAIVHPDGLRATVAQTRRH